MRLGIDDASWSVAELPAALASLRGRAGPSGGPRTLTPEPVGGVELDAAIEREARRAGMTVTPCDIGYTEAEGFVRGAGPALLVLPTPQGPRLLALGRGGRRRVTLVAPRGTMVRVPIAELCTALRRPFAELAGEVDERLAGIGLGRRRRGRALSTLLDAFTSSSRRIEGLWLVEPSLEPSLWRRLIDARVIRDAAALLGARLGLNVLLIASWWLVGVGALGGRIDFGALLAWAMVLASTIPLRLVDTWSQGRLAISIGAAVKRHLLHTSFRLDSDVVRTRGVGDLFGRVMESEAVESLVLDGGFTAAVAVIELASAAVVLGAIAGSWSLLVLLGIFTVLVVGVGAHLDRRNGRWTDERVGLTHHLVEQMVGYRTRLAQLERARWHDGEDEAALSYLGASERLDGASVLLQLLPAAWMLAGLTVLAVAFIEQHTSGTELGVIIGGLLLARGAFGSLSSGLLYLSGARVALRQIAPLLRAPRELPPIVDLELEPTSADDSEAPVLHASELGFVHPRRLRPTLDGASLEVARGEHLLVQGPSGGGKSTLGSLLAGLRVPRSGLLLLHGLDRRSLGFEGWRELVVSCPQYHENHVFNDRLAFNALMGSAWPPRPEDLQRATEVFEELGLGPLLAKMPAGMFEMVGEGWHLSHGERTRVYIARTLLQHPRVAIFDESFAALDPQTLRTVLRCVRRRSQTLIVIAHP